MNAVIFEFSHEHSSQKIFLQCNSQEWASAINSSDGFSRLPVSHTVRCMSRPRRLQRMQNAAWNVERDDSRLSAMTSWTLSFTAQLQQLAMQLSCTQYHSTSWTHLMQKRAAKYSATIFSFNLWKVVDSFYGLHRNKQFVWAWANARVG